MKFHRKQSAISGLVSFVALSMAAASAPPMLILIHFFY